MTTWTGQDWAFLLGGVGVLLTALGGLFVNIGTFLRAGNAVAIVTDVAAKVDGMLVARDAANVTAGEIMGRKAGDEAAEQRAEGRREQREISDIAALAPHPEGVPVPVADDRVAIATEKSAEANVRLADVAEKTSK